MPPLHPGSHAVGALGVALAALAWATPVAAIELNRLNACANVEATLSWLRSTEKPACRRARGALERALLKRINPTGVLPTCFLDEPPTSSHAGFSCMYTKWETSPQLFCLRETAASDIADYMQHYPDKYGVQVKKYLEDAAACPVSNGDAGPAGSARVPFELHAVARYDFGYSLALGKENPATASMVHGFARLDPALELGGRGAVEFTSMYASMGPRVDILASKAARKKKAGSWTYIADDDDPSKIFKTAIPKLNARIKVVAKSIDIERMTTPARAQADKERLSALWQKHLAKQLLDEGFEPVSADEIEEETGVDISDIGKVMAARTPYGVRDRTLIKPAAEFMIFKGSSAQPCIRDGGAIMAFVGGTLPPVGVNADYGSLMLLIIGGGPCGRSTGAAHRYITGVVDETFESLLTYLGKTP